MGGKASRESKRAAHARQWYESSQAGAEATAGKTEEERLTRSAAQKGHHTELSDLRNHPRNRINDPINLNPGQQATKPPTTRNNRWRRKLLMPCWNGSFLSVKYEQSSRNEHRKLYRVIPPPSSSAAAPPAEILAGAS